MRSLAESMSRNGRPMSHTVLSQIENQQRRVDVDELVVLAGELDTSIVSLLIPRTDSPNEIVGSAMNESDSAKDVVARTFREVSYPDWVANAIGQATGTTFRNVYGVTELIMGMQDELPEVSKDDLFKIALKTVVFLEDYVNGEH